MRFNQREIQSFMETLFVRNFPYGRTVREVELGLPSYVTRSNFCRSTTREIGVLMKVTMSLDDIKGLILSLDSYETYCHDHPNNTLVADMVADMEDAFAAEDISNPTLTMATPYFLLREGRLIPDGS